ncbi:MAG: methionine adenosyltransferase, partial [Planctomycetota bacterium]
MSVQQYLFTSESVALGHPDKVADQISDAILDAALEQDRASRVACETLVTTGLTLIAGEITTKATVDYAEIARRTIRQIGYTDPSYGFSADTCAVLAALDSQSPDIALGVDARACNETPELMPLPVMLAHRIMLQAHKVREEGVLPFLRPDGKCQVTVRYEGLRPVALQTVVLSLQHGPDVGYDELRDAFIEEIILPCLPEQFAADQVAYLVNPTGRFVVGGPHGDCGLTGRKIIVDTYGGRARHGGGCF